MTHETDAVATAKTTSASEAEPDQVSAAVPQESAPKKKGLLFRIGIGLLILYPILWLLVVVVPFLPMSVGAKAGLAAGMGGAAEVILLIAIACVGKETYQALKARFSRKKGAPARADEASVSADDA